MVEHQTYSGNPCPFCKNVHIHVMDGASDSYGRPGVYAQCQHHLCNANGPVVYFFAPEGSEQHEYLINEAPDRITAKAKAIELWNATAAVDLNDLQRAWEFYQQTTKDSTAGDTGAWKDAEDWIKKALTDLFNSQQKADLEYFQNIKEDTIVAGGIPRKYLQPLSVRYPIEFRLAQTITGSLTTVMPFGNIPKHLCGVMHSAILNYLNGPKSSDLNIEAMSPVVQALDIMLEVLKVKFEPEDVTPSVQKHIKQLKFFKLHAENGMVPDVETFIAIGD